MFYRKNKTQFLEKGLFENPTAEYRGTPFWAWNSKLDSAELCWQMECFKEMGFGGAHLHPRSGLATPYLGEEFMSCVKDCVDKARQNEMLVYLYDEDRWPSGFAGGMVTKEEAFRARHLLFTTCPYDELNEIQIASIDASARANRSGNGKLLAVYDVVLDEEGCLVSTNQIDQTSTPKGIKWFAYLETAIPSSWYNNQTYVNTLDEKAMERFIEVTYEAYKREVGNEFGKVIPSIFTDEPQFTHKTTLKTAHSMKDVILPWTDDLVSTYKEAYGVDLLAFLPELVWELPGEKVSYARYCYHDHITERFTVAFADKCGHWCRENNIMLTGHMMEEPTLESQTAALGETMRAYRGFDLPGIDMLDNSYEYTTVKQAQTAARQYGREGVLSELYGVTSWSFDFRHHKLQGDWQAAMGVTTRVPHLSMFSMAGESKRDYPASINYQVPWYKEYRLIEDHYARVNTAMTRGIPQVKVAVIHPIESYWLKWGPTEQTAKERETLEDAFTNITQWLLFGSIDFDFICESLLPDLCETPGNPLEVGEMKYDAIIVPNALTLRTTTIERLEKFKDKGGNLIFAGEVPWLIDAKENNRAQILAEKSKLVPMSRDEILNEIEPHRLVSIHGNEGNLTDTLLHQLRQDGDSLWLFVSQGKPILNHDFPKGEEVEITIKGSYRAEIYDTLTGDIRPLEANTDAGVTKIKHTFYQHDSLLVNFIPLLSLTDIKKIEGNQMLTHKKISNGKIPITLTEPNVCLLDMGEYALDNEAYQEREEILRIDHLLRERLGFPIRSGSQAQPWVEPDVIPEHTVSMRFTIESDVDLDCVSLGMEMTDGVEIIWNQVAVLAKPVGYYVDKCIKKIPLGSLLVGKNVLEIKLPYSRNTNLEWCYLLGDFGVKLQGSQIRICTPVRELDFGDVVFQGLPFYGGNIVYHLDVQEKFEAEVYEVHVPHYRGALLTVETGKERLGNLAFSPYTITLAGDVRKFDMTLFGSRVNTFGAVHMVSKSNDRHLNPRSWRTTDDSWSYEYQLESVGILTTPTYLIK